MLQLVADLTSEMWEYAPEHTVEPARAVYRINRDTRFSDDKSPYKTHIAAIFPHRRLSKNSGASFYFSVSPDRIEVACRSVKWCGYSAAGLPYLLSCR